MVPVGKIKVLVGRFIYWNSLPRLQIWMCVILGVSREYGEMRVALKPILILRRGVPGSVYVPKPNPAGETDVPQMTYYARRG